MKQLKPDNKPGLPSGRGSAPGPSLSELKTLRRAQKEVNRRVEELKLLLFRDTEQHMEQAVRIIRRWISQDKP
jgi:hypothetical protein